jgi:CopG family nickel-responsive transcriptional regulator
MGELSRIGIAIDSDLLAEFDTLIEKRGYANRSEAFRDLVRSELVEDKIQSPKQTVVGALTLAYDHHVRQLSDKLTQIQHDHGHAIVSTLHVHLDHHNCLEVIILKGPYSEVKSLADRLISTKGVKHGRLSVAVAGHPLP